MRRKEPLSTQVFNVMKPFDDEDPKSHPTSWSNLVRTRLIAEIQQEIINFYGTPHDLEARYAGLDYSYPPHQRRLARFPYHNRLFMAFDWLRLTPFEIRELCTWDGTLYAKEKYERENNVKIRDTTADAVPLASESIDTSYHPCDDEYDDDMEEGEEEEDDEYMDAQPYNPVEHGQGHMTFTEPANAHAETYVDAQGELHSLNLSLNNSLLTAALAQDQGQEPDFNVEWEQWLKEYQDSDGRWGSLLGALPSQLPSAWQL